jgi:putative transferase (TIGR04331 family)
MNDPSNPERGKRFLATTADHEFWPKDQPILFLGEWCKLCVERGILKGIEHETLPYHWDDRKKFEVDRAYINIIYEKYLEQLCDNLNRVHNVKNSKRYWRILVGFWLREFIDALYDRYLSIKNAAESGAVKNTWLSKENCMPPAIAPAYDDGYNLYLYGRIIRMLGAIPYEERERRQTSPTQKPSFVKKLKITIAKFRKRTILSVISRSFQIILKYFIVNIYPYIVNTLHARISFAGYLYLSSWDMLRLQLAVKEIPFLFQGQAIVLKSTKSDKDFRSNLIFSSGGDQFEQILNELLPDQVPMIYLENFKEMNSQSLRNTPSNPKIIVTAYSMLHRQSFEFWSAYNVEENGAKLFFVQHGGGFGSARYMFLEDHVEKAFDGYYTWGTSFEPHRKAWKMPSLRLQTTVKSLTSSLNEGGLMWLAARDSRYKTLMDTGMSGPHMSQYIEDQARFADLLCPAAQRLLIRRYRNDAWEEREIFRDRFPWLSVQFCQTEFSRYLIQTDFVDQLQRCRLMIATCNETSYLETLAANFPTIVYWNPNFFELREGVQTCFDEIAEAGILHYTPESAAEMINQVFANPREWWDSPKVQAARRAFCAKLAYTSEDWLEIWKNELLHQRDRGSPQ